MSPFTIYRKTMIFSWLKLGIGMLTLFVCIAIGGIAWFIISKMAFDFSTSFIIGCSAFLIAVAIYYIIMGRLGYSIKMGHLAIVERANRGEGIPSNPVEFSKTVVSSRFGGNRQFYGYSRNVRITIGQLRRVIARGFSLESEAPNNNATRYFTQFISNPALRCTDECCLTYALRCNDYEVNAAVVDALTIMVQEWRPFARKALKVSIGHILLCLLTFAVFFLPGFFILRDFGINTLPWIAVAFFLTLTVKIAFFDSYVLTKIVCEFLDIAKDAKIVAKSYVKLDSWSKGYAKLRDAAEKAAEKAEDDADRAERIARKHAKSDTKEEQTSLPVHDSAELVADSSQNTETQSGSDN